MNEEFGAIEFQITEMIKPGIDVGFAADNYGVVPSSLHSGYSGWVVIVRLEESEIHPEHSENQLSRRWNQLDCLFERTN